MLHHENLIAQHTEDMRSLRGAEVEPQTAGWLLGNGRGHTNPETAAPDPMEGEDAGSVTVPED